MRSGELTFRLAQLRRESTHSGVRALYLKRLRLGASGVTPDDIRELLSIVSAMAAKQECGALDLARLRRLAAELDTVNNGQKRS